MISRGSVFVSGPSSNILCQEEETVCIAVGMALDDEQGGAKAGMTFMRYVTGLRSSVQNQSVQVAPRMEEHRPCKKILSWRISYYHVNNQ